VSQRPRSCRDTKERRFNKRVRRSKVEVFRKSVPEVEEEGIIE
jgi:hypothetical protein